VQITGFTNDSNLLYNGMKKINNTNPVGYNTTSRIYTVNQTEIYVHFISDRKREFAGFQIRYETGKYFFLFSRNLTLC